MTPRNRLAPSFRTLLAALACGVALLAVPGRALADDAQTERFERTFDLEGIDRVRLQNVNGAVHLATWTRPHLRVEATKRAKGSRAERALKETEIRVVKLGTSISIETILPKEEKLFGFLTLGDSKGAEVSYELFLPAAVPVEVETVNGRIVAEGRAASLTLNTVNGSVKVEAHDAPLSVNTVNGSVDVAFSGALKPSDLETVNGSVSVACSKESSIRYELETVNGRIRSDFAGLTVEGKWGPKEARGSFNGGRERLAVETVNGEVRLLIAEAVRRPGEPR